MSSRWGGPGEIEEIVLGNHPLARFLGQGIHKFEGFLMIGFGGAAVTPALLAGNNQSVTRQLGFNNRKREVFKLHLQGFGVLLVNLGGKITINC